VFGPVTLRLVHDPAAPPPSAEKGGGETPEG
jgi:hypothetical protein